MIYFIYTHKINIILMLQRTRFNTDVEDSAVNDHFNPKSMKKIKIKQQKQFLPSTEIEVQDKNNHEIMIQVDPQEQFHQHQRMKQRIYYSVKKPKKIKSPQKYCGNQRCKICKKLKPSLPKHFESSASRGKIKPSLPKFPIIKTFNKGKQEHIILANKTPMNYRKVRSVIQIPNSRQYNHPQELIYYEPEELRQQPQYPYPHRIYTQPQQKQVLPKYMKINGKLYQVLPDEPKNDGSIGRRSSNRLLSIYKMINPILQQKYSRSNRNLQLQQIEVQYIKQRQRQRQRQKQREKQRQLQKERELKQKEKKRFEMNKQINQYIIYQTMFHYVQNNPKQINELIKKQKQPTKMTLYRLKQDGTQEGKNQLFKTIYENKKEVKQQNKPRQEEDQSKVEVYNILFPSLAQIQQRISTYQSLTGQINIEVLKKSKNYVREYSSQQNKEFLYFGGYDHEKKQRKGFGVLVTKKMILQGVWINNQILRGAELKPNSMYKGEFKDFKKHGQGTCKWLNGQQYMGEWQGGKRNGNGYWTTKNGEETYSGQWKDGKVSGYGQYYKKNYSVYKGNFDNFVKNGSGIQQFQNGDKFQGQYIHGLAFGFGKYTWQCGLIFEGEFKKGIREGKGLLVKKDLFQLTGYFQSDRPHGICQIKLSNNQVITSKFIYGQRYPISKKPNYQNILEDDEFWLKREINQKLNYNSKNIFQDE